MEEYLFTKHLVQSNRTLYTPSIFAKTNLIYLQEAGELTALQPHSSSRESLSSYLFFIVLEGKGTIQYENQSIPLKKGSCAFINCRKPYSHCSSEKDLWKLRWIHFYGPNMDSIYTKYLNRGGNFHFTANDRAKYEDLLQEIFVIANTDDPVRDMKLYAKLVNLLTFIMEDETTGLSSISSNTTKMRLSPIKEYLDQHYTESIHLDDLAKQFFINKYYLTRIFKEQYGTSITNYIIHQRITKAKQLLRFSSHNIESISHMCGIEDSGYFTRIFKKIEGVTPREYRKAWSKPGNA